MIYPGTTESWLILLLALSVALWPVMVKAGMVWGRMNEEDETLRYKRRWLAAEQRLAERDR